MVTLDGAVITFCDGCGDIAADRKSFRDGLYCTACYDDPFRYDFLGGHCCAYSASMAGGATACADCRASWF